MTRDELIAAMEKATGQSFELDNAIADWRFTTEMAEIGKTSISIWPPAYTASIDAAMTLYKLTPRYIPSNPVEVCKEALRQW